MLYACMGVFICLTIGISGLALSIVDIERYNFGLYLTLLSVVGTTIAVAFWIVRPDMCASPEWFDRATTIISIQLSRHTGHRRRRKSKRHHRHHRPLSASRRSSYRLNIEGEQGMETNTTKLMPCHSDITLSTIKKDSVQSGKNSATSAVYRRGENSPLLGAKRRQRSITWHSGKNFQCSSQNDSAFHESSFISHGCSCSFNQPLEEKEEQEGIVTAPDKICILCNNCTNLPNIRSPEHVFRCESNDTTLATTSVAQTENATISEMSEGSGSLSPHSYSSKSETNLSSIRVTSTTNFRPKSKSLALKLHPTRFVIESTEEDEVTVKKKHSGGLSKYRKSLFDNFSSYHDSDVAGSIV